MRMLAKGDLVGRAWAIRWSEEPLVKVRMAGSLFFLLDCDEALDLARQIVAAVEPGEGGKAMNASRSDDGERIVDEIRPIVAILLPPDDAEYLVKMIDYIEASNRRQGGAPLSERLHRVRAQLAAGVQAVLGSHRCEDDSLPTQEVPHSDSDVLLDTTSAAEMLGIERTTVLLHCRNGKLGQEAAGSG